MQMTLSNSELKKYVEQLLATHLPDGQRTEIPAPVFARALERTEHCFSKIHRKYYETNGTAQFDHLNSDHMAAFLYFLSNSAWRETGGDRLPTKLFYLNKIMHGLDLYFSIPMPDIFMLVHPIGTILGKAHYKDYFVVYQNCTIGSDDDVYPSFGEGVILFSRSSVVGKCAIGNNVVFGANAMVVNADVPDDTVVVGQYPTHRLIPNRVSVRARCFDPVASPVS